MVKLPEDEDTPQKRVAKIFRMMDKDEVGSLHPTPWAKENMLIYRNLRMEA